MLHEGILDYLKKDSSEKEEDDYLTGEQEKQLDKAIRLADAGEFITES